MQQIPDPDPQHCPAARIFCSFTNSALFKAVLSRLGRFRGLVFPGMVAFLAMSHSENVAPGLVVPGLVVPGLVVLSLVAPGSVGVPICYIIFICPIYRNNSVSKIFKASAPELYHTYAAPVPPPTII
jgi:hypothetical protein